MNVEFDSSFKKSITKLKSQSVAQRVADVIENVEEAISPDKIKAIKKLVGHKDYFRIRIGDYRIGVRIINANTVRFIVVAHRKNLYDFFP